MFTGIIESLGRVVSIGKEGTNRHIQIESDISHELKVDQSLSHDGVCLTVTEVSGNRHWITAVDETLSRTSVGNWREGRLVNLERSMKANDRFDGHIVQGHVDQTGVCISIDDQDGSWHVKFKYEPHHQVLVEKGSVCINGVSLTCFDCDKDTFSVAIVPYTFNHTNFQRITVGQKVNLEFDILGKYVKKLLGK